MTTIAQDIQLPDELVGPQGRMTTIAQDIQLPDELVGPRWQPVFDRQPELADVAEDTRDTVTQMAHFARLVAAMHVTAQESATIVEALQLCERVHGYGKIARALVYAAAAVESAIALTGTVLTLIAQQRGYGNAGLLVGALVESHIGMPPAARRFPGTHFVPRASSPFDEFEDGLIGAHLAEWLGWLREDDLTIARPFTALAAVFRQRQGVPGHTWLLRAAVEAHDAPDPLYTFSESVIAEAATNGLRLPAQWRRFKRSAAGRERSAVDPQRPATQS
jgi:hypothetical protein